MRQLWVTSHFSSYLNYTSLLSPASPTGAPPTVLLSCSLFLLCQPPLPNPSPLNSLSPALPLISHKQEKLHLSPFSSHLKRDKTACTGTKSSTKKNTHHETKSEKLWFHVPQAVSRGVCVRVLGRRVQHMLHHRATPHDVNLLKLPRKMHLFTFPHSTDSRSNSRDYHLLSTRKDTLSLSVHTVPSVTVVLPHSGRIGWWDFHPHSTLLWQEIS